MEYVKLGMEKHKARDYHASKVYFSKAIAVNSKDIFAVTLYFLIGEAEYKLQNFSGSIDAYSKGLNFYYLNRATFLQQGPHKVQAIEANLDQPFRVRGNAKKEMGDLTGALQDYTKSIEINNNSSDSIYSRGVVNMELGNLQQAKADFIKVSTMDRNDPMTYRNLANVRFQLSDFTGALNDYNKAIELSIHPQYMFEIYNNRALTNAFLNNIQAAINDYMLALEIKPNDALALENLEVLRNKL